jgi:hypothetical protein
MELSTVYLPDSFTAIEGAVHSPFTVYRTVLLYYSVRGFASASTSSHSP